MSAGTAFTRSHIDQTSGSLCSRLRGLVADVDLFKAWLDGISGADLLALGYTQGEVDTLVSAFSNIDGLGLLSQLYHGDVGLASPVNFSVLATRLAGPQTPRT